MSVVSLASNSKNQESVVTLTSSSTTKRATQLMDLYHWFDTIYTSVAQAMMMDAPQASTQCELDIATFANQIKDATRTAAFPPTSDPRQKKLQQLYMQKIQLKTKMSNIVTQHILDSWSALYNIAKTINAKQQAIQQEAEVTRSYYQNYIDTKLQPLVDGRKVVSNTLSTASPLITEAYKEQKQRCDAAMATVRSIQQEHNTFWEQVSTQTSLTKLKAIKGREEAAMRLANQEVDKMTAIRQTMLGDTTASIDAPSFSLAEQQTEEAERYLRNFQRIVEEECNCHKYQIVEYSSELKNLIDREILRVKSMLTCAKEEEEALIQACDADIALVWSETNTPKERMVTTFQRIDREHDVARRRSMIQQIGKRCQVMFSS